MSVVLVERFWIDKEEGSVYVWEGKLLKSTVKFAEILHFS